MPEKQDVQTEAQEGNNVISLSQQFVDSCNKIFYGLHLNTLCFSHENSQQHVFSMSHFLEGDFIFAGRSVVKKFTHKETNILVAIKFITIPMSNTSDLDTNLKKLKQEIELQKTISNFKNVTQLYGCAIQEEKLLLCMELMDMLLTDLYTLSHKNRKYFSENLLGYVGVNILDALIYLKSKNVIHRDVKPLNTLINRHGQIKLCDFGTSRFLEESFATTVTGTILYWPPELFTMSEAKYDIRNDVWALGITLAESSYGKYPIVEEISGHSNLILIQNSIKKVDASNLIDKCLIDKSDIIKEFVKLCISNVKNRPKYDELKKTKFYQTFSESNSSRNIQISIKETEQQLNISENLQNQTVMINNNEDQLHQNMKKLTSSLDTNMQINDTQDNNRNVIIVKRLDKKALIRNPNLLSAALENNIDLVRTLLEQCADPNVKNLDGNIALHNAAENKDDNNLLVELLLEYGADIDSQNKNGGTCLMSAAINNNIEIVRCLLQNGADINRKDKSSNSVLHYAAGNKNDNKFIIELLLKNGADIDSQNEDGNTCLMLVAINNNIEIVRCLLQNDADINRKNSNGENVLHYAAENKNDNKLIIELLLEYDADIDSQDKDGATCLMIATRNNNIEIVRCLLQNGADINKKDSNGENVLHYAALNNIDNEFIIELLLKNGADINSQDNNGDTCLMCAARNNKINIVCCLLQNGADINKKSNCGSNVLHFSISNNIESKFIIELLLKNGADIDSQDQNGDTCLMIAARNNNIEIVRYLLQNDADINKQNRFGKTTIQIARSNEKDNKEVVELLLDYEREKSKNFFKQIYSNQ